MKLSRTISAALLLAACAFANNQATVCGKAGFVAAQYAGGDFNLSYYSFATPNAPPKVLAKQADFAGENISWNGRDTIHCTSTDAYVKTLQLNIWDVKLDGSTKPQLVDNRHGSYAASVGFVDITTYGDRVIKYGRFTGPNGPTNLAIDVSNNTVMWDADGATVVRTCITGGKLIGLTQLAGAQSYDPADVWQVGTNGSATKIGNVTNASLFRLSCGDNGAAVLAEAADGQHLIPIPDTGTATAQTIAAKGEVTSLAVAKDNTIIFVLHTQVFRLFHSAVQYNVSANGATSEAGYGDVYYEVFAANGVIYFLEGDFWGAA